MNGKLGTGLILIMLMGFGCASGHKYLPSSQDISPSDFRSFNVAKKAYVKVEINKTTVKGLKELGFYDAPNVDVLNYVEVQSLFLSNPSININSLPRGVRQCLEAQEKCQAYRANPGTISQKQEGSFWLYTFNFKKETRRRGWGFSALFVFVDKDGEKIVVYKLFGGRPQIDKYKVIKKPLGPLQGLDSFFKKAVNFFF